jgi:hypothetical protein
LRDFGLGLLLYAAIAALSAVPLLVARLFGEDFGSHPLLGAAIWFAWLMAIFWFLFNRRGSG